jgi:hypothetical protein
MIILHYIILKQGFNRSSHNREFITRNYIWPQQKTVVLSSTQPEANAFCQQLSELGTGSFSRWTSDENEPSQHPVCTHVDPQQTAQVDLLYILPHKNEQIKIYVVLRHCVWDNLLQVNRKLVVEKLIDDHYQYHSVTQILPFSLKPPERIHSFFTSLAFCTMIWHFMLFIENNVHFICCFYFLCSC